MEKKVASFLPTLDDTLGPYFPPCFAANEHLELFHAHPGLVTHAQGEQIHLALRLVDIDGKTATGSLLEVWQPNSQGVLRVPGSEDRLAGDPYFQGYGRAFSSTGVFTVSTVMPGAMRAPSIERAPFLTLSVFTDGISRIVTQIFFEGNAMNANDPVLSRLPEEIQERLVAKSVGLRNGLRCFAMDLKMRGDEETPFFDDAATYQQG